MGRPDSGDAAAHAAATMRRLSSPRSEPRVRVAVQLPTDHVQAGAEFVSGDAIAAMARAAEDAGLDAVSVTRWGVAITTLLGDEMSSCSS